MAPHGLRGSLRGGRELLEGVAAQLTRATLAMNTHIYIPQMKNTTPDRRKRVFNRRVYWQGRGGRVRTRVLRATKQLMRMSGGGGAYGAPQGGGYGAPPGGGYGAPPQGGGYGAPPQGGGYGAPQGGGGAPGGAALDAEPGDEQLNCRDCRTPFLFTAGQQAFYAEKGPSSA